MRPFPREERAGRLVVLASGFAGDDDALRLRAHAWVLGATIKPGQSVAYPLGRNRRAYLVPATGKIEIANLSVAARDGVAIADLDT